MGADYHKIQGSFKKGGRTATSWGWGRVYEFVEKTIYKLSYEFRRSLGNNDDAKSA